VLIVGGNQSAGGYEVDNSLRFDDGSSDYLTKTFGSSATSDKIGTYSSWIKRSTLGEKDLFAAPGGGNRGFIRFEGDDQLRTRTLATANQVKTSMKFRDLSAWYHIVIAYDTTQSTASNRVKIYINGSQQTDLSATTYPSQNSSIYWGQNGIQTEIGYDIFDGGGGYYDGYMAEVVWIDGQALDPTSFGEFDADTGIWKPIDVSGLTFGTNGFYLPFENSAALGQDDSGNGNNFTVNNLTSDDQTTDTPTNNYATWNRNIKSPIILSEGNLEMGGGTLNWDSTVTTIVPQKGKWYAEIKVTSLVYDNIGFVTIDSFTDGTGRFYEKSNNISWLNNVSTIRNYQGASSTTAAVTGGSNSGFSRTSGDIVMLAFDMENGYGWFGKNGTWLNSGDPASGTNAFILSSDYANGTAIYAGYYSAVIQANFGNSSFTISSGNSDGNGYGNFEYSVPSGYYALNTKNLAEYG